MVPIPQIQDPTDPMQFRPSMLLQAGYKAFAKILAWRLQAGLWALINEDQQGFVRGRPWQRRYGRRSRSSANHPAADTVDKAPFILLLDFAKAYDTLDRAYLLRTLQAFGFDAKFRRLVQNMHQSTTALFLLNGELSRGIPISRV